MFTIQPEKATVQPASYFEFLVTYFPQNVLPNKPDEEFLVMKIANGGTMSLKCIGNVNESKCVILKHEIAFGQIPVCKKVEELITIKNQQKFTSVYNVDIDLPPYTEVEPMKGKLGPDQT